METESSTAQTWHRRQYNLFPEKDRGSTYERRKNMKLNIKKFMMTEMGGELEETIKAWDQALEEWDLQAWYRTNRWKDAKDA